MPTRLPDVLSSQIRELRLAARSLGRSPLTTCSIVATLGICIGAVAAMYSLVDAVLVRALPYERPDRLVWISSVSPDRPDRPFSLPELLDYRAQTTTTRIGAYASLSAIVESPDGEGARRLAGLRVTADGLTLLGVRPLVGRTLIASDDAAIASRVVADRHVAGAIGRLNCN